MEWTYLIFAILFSSSRNFSLSSFFFFIMKEEFTKPTHPLAPVSNEKKKVSEWEMKPVKVELEPPIEPDLKIAAEEFKPPPVSNEKKECKMEVDEWKMKPVKVEFEPPSEPVLKIKAEEFKPPPALESPTESPGPRSVLTSHDIKSWFNQAATVERPQALPTQGQSRKRDQMPQAGPQAAKTVWGGQVERLSKGVKVK